VTVDVTAAPERAWQLDASTVADALDTDPQHGLDGAEAQRRLELFGPNELPRPRERSNARLFAQQFANAMSILLLGAAAVTLVIGDLTDTVVIGAIVVLNAVIGYAQEARAQRAAAALAAFTSDTTRVVRNGTPSEYPSSELVPGAVVELVQGDVVPADLRLTDVRGLQLNEATLTGESESVAKRSVALPGLAPGLLAARENMAFKGTVVTYGRARGIAVVTGTATELGRIAELLDDDRNSPTPLQRRLAVLGRRLAGAAAVVCVAVFTVGVASGEPAQKMFLTAVSLAVAAIPEGLPAVVTVALALGSRRMAERHAIVRRLAAVEALGSVTVICTDKTGTLTEHRMTVERAWTATGIATVSGTGYRPEGVVEMAGGPDAEVAMHRLAWVAAACNDAVLHGPLVPDADWTITGDPTEAALLSFAAKLGVERDDVERERPRHAEIPFDAERRRMATVHRVDDGWWVAVKGALGALAPLIDPVDAETLARAEEVAAQFAREGSRVLALAERTIDGLPDPLDAIERGLRLVGVVGITDPPRASAAPAIATCRRAGIVPVMLTGDDPRTARAIASRLALVRDDAGLLTGDEVDALDDHALAEHVEDIGVYARTSPEQKLRIVEAWQARGAIVAMTGDGVNDAPSLQRADIGVAMGLNGTDVSRDAADVVLADDNFATIVDAVGEGRRIYDNIRRVVRYLLSTNSGELWVMLLAPLFGLPLPLLPAQILWINLVTDGLPAVALGLEPAEPDTMRRPPRRPEESVLGAGLWQHALWVGLLMAIVTLLLLGGARAEDWPWRTVVFTTLAFLGLGHALAVRSEQVSTFRLGFRSNPAILVAVLGGVLAQLAVVYLPALQQAFATRPLGALQLAVVAVVSSTTFFAVELEKWIRRKRGSRRQVTEVPVAGVGRSPR
jgi:P-type Ca2+ transporter type 2C